MEYCDVCCYLQPDLQNQLRELRSFGVAKAILSSPGGVSVGGVSAGRSENERLLEAVREHDGLYAAAVIHPSGLNGGLRELLAGYKSRKCKAVRIYPAAHHAEPGAYGPLFEAAAELNLLLIVEHTECSFDGLDHILQNNPGLAVLLDGADKKLLYHCGDLLRLLGRHRRLYLETHHLNQYGMLDYIVKTYGPARVLFGSYYPYYSPDASAGLITYLDTDESGKETIMKSKGFDFYDEN